MAHKLCACCGKSFDPRPQIPHQAYCSSPACQRARKRQWQQDKVHSDPDYRDNQRDAQRAWLKRHPDYWRQYRHDHPDYGARNRTRKWEKALVPADGFAKMDASPIAPGLYRIRPAATPWREDQDSWIVRIEPVCTGCPCKKDVCKERT